MSGSKVLLLDNYDSFVHNLARTIEELGQRVEVVRNDRTTVDEVARSRPAALVLSPGPGTPRDAGICVQLVEELSGRIPILGVCLGHQAVAVAFGATVRASGHPMHGVASRIHHEAGGLFAGCANPIVAGRYHSLVVVPETLPEELHVSAWCEDAGGRTVMAVRHRLHETFGLQFHPESILTAGGHRLVGNFLRLAGLAPRLITTADPVSGVLEVP